MNQSDNIHVRASELNMSYGGQSILSDVEFTIEKNKAILLRGDNGSGKTTLLNILSGFTRPQRGTVFMRKGGRAYNLTCMEPDFIMRLGLGRLWQDIRLFPTMSALENVLVASPGMSAKNPFYVITSWNKVRKWEREARDMAMHNLSMVGMADRAESSADKLSLGQMKRIALARILQCGAKLLLLDEPLAGLDNESAEALMKILEDLRNNEEKTLFIVEHRHEHITGLCDEVWYLNSGKLLNSDMLK